jgi:hypothetical protein
MSLPRALGSIIPMLPEGIGEAEIYLPLFDYFDSWETFAGQPGTKEGRLSQPAMVLAQDLVNAAVYSHQVLGWRDRAKEPEGLGSAVVIVCTLTEGFLVSLRSAWDALAMAVSVGACEKPGQAPHDSLRALLKWAGNNKKRVHPKLRPILTTEVNWFWKLRTLRDYLVHQGSIANIFFDGDNFLLTLIPHLEGGPVQEPLLPILGSACEHLLDFAYRATEALQEVVPLPPERKRSRVLHSPFIPYLKTICGFCSEPTSQARHAMGIS